MLVANFTTVRPDMGSTRTYEDFSKFLGERPHRFGLVSRLYPNYTATFLTESLRNVFYGDNKKAKGFQSVDSTYFEWDVEVNQVKRVLIKNVQGTGINGTEIEMTFGENYYQLHEIFKIENTEQQCMVVSRPVRKSDKDWCVMVRLIDTDYSSAIVESEVEGSYSRFIGNAKPELHDVGFVKYQSKITLLLIA